jgi:hypothetical protein
MLQCAFGYYWWEPSFWDAATNAAPQYEELSNELKAHGSVCRGGENSLGQADLL